MHLMFLFIKVILVVAFFRTSDLLCSVRDDETIHCILFRKHAHAIYRDF